MAIHNLGPIARPTAHTPRVTLRPDYSGLATAVILDLRVAMDQARRKMVLWELLSVYRDPDGYGSTVVRIVGDGACPRHAILLEVNGVATWHPTRQAAYIALIAKRPDCMLRAWQWAFVPFPSWGQEVQS